MGGDDYERWEREKYGSGASGPNAWLREALAGVASRSSQQTRFTIPSTWGAGLLFLRSRGRGVAGGNLRKSEEEVCSLRASWDPAQSKCPTF